MLGAAVFQFNNKNYLCIIDYHSKFPIVKRMEGLLTENLIATAKVIFAEYGILCKFMSDTGTNFISDRFRKFCRSLNMEQAVSSAHHHQCNGQVKACIKSIKCTFKKCADSSGDINMDLLQIHTTPLGQGLPSPATLLFNQLVCHIMPVLDRKPIGRDYDDEHHNRLTDRQHRNNSDASPVFASIPIGSAVVVQQEDSRLETHLTVVRTGDHNHHDC